MEHHRRAPIVPGLLLILLGLWFLGRQLDLPLFVGQVIWPWLLIAAGVIIWARYIFLPPRSADDLFWGTGAILAGAFLLAWENGYFLADVRGWDKLWPMIPLIMGISALVQWVFNIRNWGALIFGLAAGAAGVVGLGYTTGTIDAVTAWSISRFWPVLLVIAGLGIMIQAVSSRRGSDRT